MGKSFILPSRVPGRGIVEITYILVAPLLPIMPDYGACEKVKANQDHPVWRGERRASREPANQHNNTQTKPATRGQVSKTNQEEFK